MGMRKIVHLPVDSYIKKFLETSVVEDYLEDSLEYAKVKFLNSDLMCLVHKNYLPTVRKDRHEAAMWLSNVPPNSAWVYCEVTDPKPERLFALRNHLITLFKRQIIRHMSVSKLVRGDAMSGLREFLDKCDISEEDYKAATGYKHWQRYQKKLKKRQQHAA